MQQILYICILLKAAKPIIPFLVFLLWSALTLEVNAALPDSVNQKLAGLGPEERTGELIHLARVYSRINSLEFAQSLAEEGEKEAKALQNDSLILKAKFIIGSCYEERGFYRMAIKTYESALALAKEKGTLEDQSQFYNAMGICYDYLGKYNDAITYYLEAQKINEELGYEEDIAYVWINIGLIRFNQKNYSEAETNFLEALEIGEKLNSDKIRGLVWSNLGMLENERNDLDKTLYYHQKTLEIDLKQVPVNSEWVGSDYSSLGNVWLKKGYPDSALYYHLLGLSFKKIGMANRPLATSHIQLSDFYQSQKNWLLAAKHLDSAKFYAQSIEDPALELEILRSEAQNLLSIGKGNEAAKLYERYIHLSDSLQQAQNYAAGKLLEEEFNLEIKERDLLEMESELSSQKRKNRNVLVILTAFIGLSALLVWLYVQNTRKNKELSLKQEQLDIVLSELQKKNEEIIHKNDELEDALSIKTRFLSVISHEIRTPLHVILGMAESLKEEWKDSEKVKAEGTGSDYGNTVQILHGSTLQLIQLVNEVLDLNKLEHGSASLKKESFSLTEMLHTLEGPYKLECKRKNIGFQIKLADQLPQYLFADRVKLEQILNNLLNNAIKFTESGSVQLSIHLLEESEKEALIAFHVNDTGIGIPEIDIPKIFDPFFQSDGDTNRSYGGTGLGLAISKSLIELMKGQIKLESTQGLGTQISFQLPLAKGSAASAQPINLPLDWKWPDDKRILVAEDHLQNQLLLKMMLQKIGATATWTSNGAECVEAASQQHFDIILLDMHMPVMDGYEAARFLRERFGSSIYIMGLTAANVAEVNEKAESLFDSVLYKPYPQDKLYQLLREAVTKKPLLIP